MIRRLLTLLALVAASFGAQAASTTLFTSAAYDQMMAGASSSNGGFWCSSCSGSYQVSDVFSLGQDSTVTGFTVGILNTENPLNLTVSVWDANLSTQLYSSSVAADSISHNPIVANGTDVISASLDPVSLGAGSYRISWYDPNLLGIWNVATGINDLLWQTYPAIGSANAINYERNGTAGFQILGNVSAVPLPAAAWLFGSGILGLFGFAKRRKFAS